jgi:hypothetical protein
MNSASQTDSKRSAAKYAAGLLASSAVLLAGCSNMATTATNISSLGGNSASVAGSVHGGNQPVYNATVTLYSTGQSGVGSSGTTLAATTTDTNGNFQFSQQATPSSGSAIPAQGLGGNTYECGNKGDSLLYIVARGGNTTGTGSASVNNSASVFLAPVGFCSVASSTHINVTEATTAAMAAATGQFINPTTEQIGADGTLITFQQLSMAFQTVANLVDPNTGLAVQGKLVQGASTSSGTQTYNVSGVSMQITPEYQKVNTVADILSACINQSSSSSATNCSTLFANAVPPASASTTSQPNASFPTATDTLQAALYMFINPSDTTSANRTNLYNLVTASAPFQPTLASLPTDWTIGILYGSGSSCDAPASGSKFFSGPRGLAVDQNGNVWISNTQSSSSALVALSPLGQPLVCQTIGTTLASGGTSAVTVDDQGGVWYGDSGSSTLTRYKQTTNSTLSFPTAAPPIAITANGSDDVFYTAASGSTGSLYKIKSGASATSSNGPVQISQVVGPSPASLFPDTAGDIWVTSGSNFVTEVAEDTGGGNNFLNGYSSNPFSVASPATSVSVGSTNYIYTASAGSANSLTIMKPSAGSFAVTTVTAANTGGENMPNSIALGGSANIWIANGAANSNASYALSQISSTGAALSASGTANGGYQKSSGYFQALRTVIVDFNGNVWTTSDGIGQSIVETVGAAVPVYGAFAYGLTQSRFQQIP